MEHFHKYLTVLAVALLLLSPSFAAGGQERTTVNSWALSFSSLRIADHSLSNLQYAGLLVCVNGRHGAFYRSSDRLSWEISDRFGVAPSMINTAKTNLVDLYCLNLGFGTYWNTDPERRFRFKAGCVAEASGGWKNSPKFMNNSLSVDGRLMLSAAAGAGFFFRMGKCGCTVGWDGTVPLAGVMFVPGKGLTASEVAWKNAWGDSFHFASLHNCQGVKGCLRADFMLGFVDLRIAFLHDHLWWNASGVQFYSKEFGVQVGIVAELSMHGRTGVGRKYF
ncbi:MAG: hypothetical protein ACI4TM_03790 [Candidatus Cryptobacteroides sp.]